MTSPDAYVRRARSLRARYGKDPVRLHAALRELAQGKAEAGKPERPGVAGRAVTPTKVRPVVVGVPGELAELFATEVEAQIESGLLRYSARKALLARGERLGLSRFDANLIIASVLHRSPVVHQTPRGGSAVLAVVAMIAVAVVLLALWR